MISRSCNRIETFYVLRITHGSHENKKKSTFCQPLKCAYLRMTSMFIDKKHCYCLWALMHDGDSNGVVQDGGHTTANTGRLIQPWFIVTFDI